ncbi:MAG: exodeoxyribonuclease VII large subunit, partial [Terracidiphilus sp.]
QRLIRLPLARAEGRMNALLRRLQQRLDDLSFRREAAVSSQLRLRQRRAAELTAAVLRHDPHRNLGRARERLAVCRARLDRVPERMAGVSKARLGALEARLHSLSPLAVLDRGYALVLDAAGSLVRSARQIAPGDRLMTRLADGTFISRVESAANPPSRK